MIDMIKNYFTLFQKEIVELKQSLVEEKQESFRKEREILLELFETIDALDILLENLRHKKNQDISLKRTIKNIESISRKILRILQKRGIDVIEFPDNKAAFGKCKIVDTQNIPELAEETIIKIVKIGFGKGDEIIRPADVITVKYDE